MSARQHSSTAHNPSGRREKRFKRGTVVTIDHGGEPTAFQTSRYNPHAYADRNVFDKRLPDQDDDHKKVKVPIVIVEPEPMPEPEPEPEPEPIEEESSSEEETFVEEEEEEEIQVEQEEEEEEEEEEEIMEPIERPPEQEEHDPIWNSKVFKRLDLRPVFRFGQWYGQMSNASKLLLEHLGEDQVRCKRDWAFGLWALFHGSEVDCSGIVRDSLHQPTVHEDEFWARLAEVAGLEEPVMKEWNKEVSAAARDAVDQFMRWNLGGMTFHMKAAITGLPNTGKSMMLSTMFIRILMILAQGSGFKNTFLLPLNCAAKKVTTMEDYYDLVSSAVISALVLQRPDLKKFHATLSRAFSDMPKAKRMRRLPKLPEFQRYLRGPAKECDAVLKRMWKCLRDPQLADAFLTNVALLPRTVATIFGFKSTIVIADHIDVLDLQLKVENHEDVQLFEFVKFGLSQTQYLITGVDGDDLVEKLQPFDDDCPDLSRTTELIHIFGIVKSKFPGYIIKAEYKNGAVAEKKELTADDMMGCPRLTEEFDTLCQILPSADERRSVSTVKVEERAIVLMRRLYDLTDVKVNRISLVRPAAPPFEETGDDSTDSDGEQS